MNIFFNERRFWRNVLERLIDIALFLSERNLAFRGSEEVLGSPHNGNFPGIFELLARRDPIQKELQDRIKNKNTKDHYLSPTIQNELIELLATEVEKENLQQLKLAKYFSIILDCTPDMSHHEQMSVILRYVLCNEEAAVVKETFFGYLRISDSTGKGLLDAFLEKATELQLELSDCRDQSYDNGANIKGKHSGVRAKMLDINPKAVYVPCANHTQSRSTPISGPPPKVSARALAHRSYHFRGVKLKSCIKKIHHNLYISKQANVRIKHADTEGASHKKFGTDARVQ